MFVRARNYKKSLRALLAIGPTVKKALLNEVLDIIRNEMKEFQKKRSILESSLSFESVTRFCWEEALQEFDSLPCLSSCIKAAMCRKKSQNEKIPEYVSMHGIIIEYKRNVFLLYMDF